MSGSGVDHVYCTESIKSIAQARNTCLDHATGEAVAFIDDDEIPGSDWLKNLYDAMLAYKASAVLGPVCPFFDSNPPSWLLKAGFYQRPRHRSGDCLSWRECRTGNVLMDRNILKGLDPVFLPEFVHGGEDQDLFYRLGKKGYRFVWCDEAPVHEFVPPSRWKRSHLVRTALLRGTINSLHPDRNLAEIFSSMMAIPLYGFALPLLPIMGHHYFMRYLTKLCDHLGRLLALIGLNPVKSRIP